MARIPINHRILTCDSPQIDFSGEPAINLSDDTVFQYLSEECLGLSPASSVEFDNEEDGDNDNDNDEKENQNENENENRGAGDDNFWESQYQLLQVSFYVFTIRSELLELNTNLNLIHDLNRLIERKCLN